jgi:hypothetical protein
LRTIRIGAPVWYWEQATVTAIRTQNERANTFERFISSSWFFTTSCRFAIASRESGTPDSAKSSALSDVARRAIRSHKFRTRREIESEQHEVGQKESLSAIRYQVSVLSYQFSILSFFSRVAVRVTARRLGELTTDT